MARTPVPIAPVEPTCYAFVVLGPRGPSPWLVRRTQTGAREPTLAVTTLGPWNATEGTVARSEAEALAYVAGRCGVELAVVLEAAAAGRARPLF